MPKGVINAGTFGQPGRVGGRPKGIPDKRTQEARHAIAQFVDGNAHRLQAWLDDIANGVQARDVNGVPVVDKNLQPVYVIAPNPEKAFTLFQSVVEYHVPKLARQEISGPDGGGLTIQIIKLSDQK